MIEAAKAAKIEADKAAKAEADKAEAAKTEAARLAAEAKAELAKLAVEAKAELDAANLAEAKSAEAKSAKAVSKAEAFPPPGINDETRHRLESEEQFSNFLSDCKRWIEAIAKHSGGLPALIESTQRDRQLAVDQEVKSIDDDEKKLKGHESRLVELRNELKLNNDKIEENQKLLESSVPDSQSQDGDESQMPEVNIQATELQGIINKL